MKPSSTSKLRRCKRLALASLAVMFCLMATAVLFNWLVDPYAVYGRPRLPGFNEYKTRLHKNARFVKAMRLHDHPPRQLILGTSRAEYGLDPQHPGWQAETFGDCYNAALSGANIYEMWRFLQHAAANAPLRRVVVALDFFSFNIHCRDGLGDLDDLLAADSGGRPRRRATYLRLKYRQLLSLDLVEISYATIRRQDEQLELILADGRRADGDIAEDIGRAGGHRAAFEQNVRTYYGFGYLPRPYKAFTFDYADHPASPPAHAKRDAAATTFDYFRHLVRMAHRQGIDLRLIISPSHAWQWETVQAAGLWPQFEQWKRQLVDILRAEAAATGQTPFPLWDFADYSQPTCETVPPAGDPTPMQYYWEASHYRKQLGDLVLDRVLATPDIPSPLSEFGLLLTVGDLDQHLATIARRAAAYRQNHPDDIARIQFLWADEAARTH